MRVLHVYAGNLYGGVESLLATFARQRDLAPGMEPRFALCFDGRLAHELREAGNPPAMLGRVRASLPWSVGRVRRRLQGVLAEERPDVVVCHSAWSHGIFAPVVRRAGLPLAFWQHDAVTGRTREERRARRVAPDLAVSTSRWAAGSLPLLFPQVRAEVVHPSVPPPESVLSRAERAALRQELATHWAETVIVQVARMEEWKGHRLLLEALGRLRDLPGWVLWLVGGSQRPEEERYGTGLSRLALRFGISHRVRFAGERGDVRRVLAASDILCQPNLGPEPFGIACVEGMYARLPVVATALGGPTETVDETCGILVPPENPGALAEALRRLVEDPQLAAKLGDAGPARARELSDPEAQARRLASVLSSLVKERVS